jgi:hypothetical protein
LKKFLSFVRDLFAIRAVGKIDIFLSLFLAVIVGTLATELVNFLIRRMPQNVPEGLEMANEVLRNTDGYLLLTFLFSVCIFAPIVEEVIFRGILWWPIERLLSSNIALVVTSILFALAHVDLFHIVAVFPLGLLFGFLRKRTNSIWPAIIAHAANNTMASLSLIF